MTQRILGIDPGLRITGYGLIEVGARGATVVEAGVLRSAEPKTKPDLARRVQLLHEGVVEILEQWKPNVMAVEQLFAHYEHPRTAILMAHARGCFLLAAATREIPVASYAATRVKKSVTGSGRASKDQVRATVVRELGLKAAPEPVDISDALAIALCHHYMTARSLVRGTRSATFTGINRAALDAATRRERA